LYRKINRRFPLVGSALLSIFYLELALDGFKILGFNKYLQSISPTISKNKLKEIDVELSEILFVNKRINSFEELQDRIVKRVNKKLSQAEKICLVKFRLNLIFGRERLFTLIRMNTPCLPDLLPKLQKSYLEFGKIKSDLQYKETELKIVLHIRQGDTSIIKTQWHSWINVDRRRNDYLKQFSSIDELELTNQYQPSDYAIFLKALLSFINSNNYSVRCFSDGYGFALKILMKNAHEMRLSSTQSKSLKKYQKKYEKEVFQEFYELNNTSCIIGESSKNLCNLISSILSADIVITSNQQYMVQKLLSFYGSKETPFVIVLYKNSIPDYPEVTFDNNNKFTYVDIDNPVFSHILEKLNDRFDCINSTNCLS